MIAGEEVRQAEAMLQARVLEPAWRMYEIAQAAGADPDICSAGRWMIAMLRGDFEHAWRESDAIRRRGANDPYRFWQGEDLRGKRVILRCLHGFGDSVQMLRYAPLIREQAADLIVETAPRMLELTRHFDGIDQVIAWGADAPNQTPQWDVQIEVNELPYILRTQARELPMYTRYLKLPRSLTHTAEARSYTPGNLRVGVVWASGEWNPSRSIQAPLLAPLLKTPNVEFWNLQGGASRAQWQHFQPIHVLHAAEECTESVMRLAALIQQLDLVITTDTLAAHLSGALGTAAWVLLEHAADWRWQHQRSDSPWYPTLRLFRQQTPGAWKELIKLMQGELMSLARKHMTKALVA